MATLSFIIALCALVIAYLAYSRSGGSTEDLKRKVEELGASTETLRSRMADALDTLEKKVRGDEKKSESHPES